MEKNLTKGSVLKALLLFSLPFLLSTFLQTLYGLADLFIIGGTSLTVYPAANLIHYFRGENLVIINRDATPQDKHCKLVFHENLGQVFSAIEI